MFQKPFKTKSNLIMKNSERRTFKSTILQQHENITEKDLEFLFANKETISVLKIVTYHNDIVQVYLVQKRPMFFGYNNKIFPTVYLMWQLPHIVPSFTIQTPVFDRITSGADLMLPGVLMPDNMKDNMIYGQFDEGSSLSINLKHNKAPFAIGTATLSSTDMLKAGGRGKCIKVLHSFGDKLWMMEGCTTLPIPELGPPEWVLVLENCDNQINDPFNAQNNSTPPQLISDKLDNEPPVVNSVWGKIPKIEETIIQTPVNVNDNDVKSSVDEMDSLFQYCFLKALKQMGKKSTLPILTSNFFKLMMQVCPYGKSLDIKKSSFKKFSKFTKQMMQDGIISITEQPKGVENITAFDANHPLLRSFVLNQDDDFYTQTEETAKGPHVMEAYTVTAAVLPIFKSAGYSKGDSIKNEDFRTHIVNYIKKNDLQDKEMKGIIKPNAELAGIIKSDKPVTWEQVMQRLTSSMSTCFKVTSVAGNEVKGKGKIEPIVISVATRSGNKKVTLIDNLELYGIQLTDFGKECQHGVAASTSISKPPGKKYSQLLVQGNQVLFIGNLLMDKYKVPKRYIRGLELAPKKK